MNLLRTGLTTALVVLMGAAIAHGQGVDRVHRRNGVDAGTITAITPLQVTISKGGVESTVAVEDVKALYFAGEPGELNSARAAFEAGRAQDALDALAKIDAAAVRREEIQVEIEFYTAAARAQLALAGRGEESESIAQLRTFVAQRRTSLHLSRAIELVGDLLAASGQWDEARAEYAKLAKAPGPYFEFRAALLAGRTLQGAGDHGAAVAEFDRVINSAARGGAMDELRLAATLDRAISQAGAGQGAEAASAIGTLIAQADPNNHALLARAFTALGDAYLQAGDKQGALFAFLHVDLLYAGTPEFHAKALSRLATLWRDAGRENRAQEAAEKLANKYPESRWARN